MEVPLLYTQGVNPWPSNNVQTLLIILLLLLCKYIEFIEHKNNKVWKSHNCLVTQRQVASGALGHTCLFLFRLITGERVFSARRSKYNVRKAPQGGLWPRPRGIRSNNTSSYDNKKCEEESDGAAKGLFMHNTIMLLSATGAKPTPPKHQPVAQNVLLMLSEGTAVRCTEESL